MELTDQIVRIMKTGRVDQEYHGSRINSLDFHRSSDMLVTAADNDTIKLYGLAMGIPQKVLHSKKYGISKVRFSHHKDAIVFASNKGTDHSLRYLDTHENGFIRYFSGHSAKVTSLNVSSHSDLIMSTSQDRTMRLWDLRVAHSQALLQSPSGIPTAAFDLQGVVFAVGIDSGIIKLYDVRSYDKGPFATFLVQDERNLPGSFSQLQFSPKGDVITGVVGDRIYQLDSFSGALQQKYSSGIPVGAPSLEMCYSNDNKYLLSGHQDCSIKVWQMTTGQQIASWAEGHLTPPTCLGFAPRRLLVASACNQLDLWIPAIADLRQMGLVK